MRQDRSVPHSSHWGAFQADVRDGRVVGVTPFEKDPDPSGIINSIPDALYHPSRIPQPMVRKGWLDKGPGGDREWRGADPFVPVEWSHALDLVAAELERVKQAHGNKAIFGGSYGWSSAGRFHHARTQLHRFLNQYGGFTDQVQNYSYAAAVSLLPYIVGSIDAVQGPLSSWDGIAADTKLMVVLRRHPDEECPGRLRRRRRAQRRTLATALQGSRRASSSTSARCATIRLPSSRRSGSVRGRAPIRP